MFITKQIHLSVALCYKKLVLLYIEYLGPPDNAMYQFLFALNSNM